MTVSKDCAPKALSGKPSFIKRSRPKRSRSKRPAGMQVFTPNVGGVAHQVKPPDLLVAQVARWIIGDTSGYRTDWPKPLLLLAANAMHAAHYSGLERTGAKWVRRTINQLNRKSQKSRAPP